MQYISKDDIEDFISIIKEIKENNPNNRITILADSLLVIAKKELNRSDDNADLC